MWTALLYSNHTVRGMTPLPSGGVSFSRAGGVMLRHVCVQDGHVSCVPCNIVIARLVSSRPSVCASNFISGRCHSSFRAHSSNVARGGYMQSWRLGPSLAHMRPNRAKSASLPSCARSRPNLGQVRPILGRVGAELAPSWGANFDRVLVEIRTESGRVSDVFGRYWA